MVPLIDSKICRVIVLRAPVKSGKREIVEYSAMRDIECKKPKRVHGFISAWHRTADLDQRNELTVHNIQVFSIINDDTVTKFHNCLD